MCIDIEAAAAGEAQCSTLDPERVGDYHDEPLPADIYMQAVSCSIC